MSLGRSRSIAAAAAALVLTALLVPRGPGVSAAAPAVLRVGAISPRLASLPEFMAGDLLSRRGYRVEWQHFQSDGAIIQAMAGRALDFAIATPVAAAHANEQGAPVRMITVAWATLDWVLVARQGIATINDLSGRTVAISSPGSPTDILFRRLLETRNLTPERLRVTMARVGATGARAAALESGRADAAWLGYDYAYELIKKGGFHVLENISVAKAVPGFLIAVWMASQPYIDTHREAVLAAVQAQIEANRWAHNRIAFIDEALRARWPGMEPLPRDVVEWAYDRYIQDDIFPVNGGLTPAALNSTFEIARLTGDLSRIPAPGDVAVFQIQDAVLAKIGRR
ncbi:MAG TPA: ABC transporter substrate-binding protein [bacterium]|nr:ABC transporter substrate-binding protein [bacterium]